MVTFEPMICIIQKLEQYVAFQTYLTLRIQVLLQITYKTSLLKRSESSLF